MEFKDLTDALARRSQTLTSVEGLAPFLESIADKKLVMLGESSHGTDEFYSWRREISLELIRNHGFQFIAVEGDWPSCQGIGRYVRDEGTNAIAAMTGFTRWPTWMWANSQVLTLMDDLLDHNRMTGEKVGFHGLDVYSLYDSLDEVIRGLSLLDPALADRARELYACFEPYRHDERAYLHSLYRVPEGCKTQVMKALTEILESKLSDGDEVFAIEQNARIVRNAENYYRAMISHNDDSWNVRDRHMLETLDLLLRHYGPDAKGIVWAHNTHIGDYRATDMAIRGNVNIGGLAREKYGEEAVALVGFSTYSGSVIASSHWDGPIEVMPVPVGIPGSLESAFHATTRELEGSTLFADLRGLEGGPLLEAIGHRAIGVVYDPHRERWGNYVTTIPAKRYDAMIFCDETHALAPLNVKFMREKIPETFPYGKRI